MSRGGKQKNGGGDPSSSSSSDANTNVSRDGADVLFGKVKWCINRANAVSAPRVPIVFNIILYRIIYLITETGGLNQLESRGEK